MNKVIAGKARGMTLLEIMIVLAILALVMGLLVGPRVMKLFAESKEDIARLTEQKFVNEAYPLWSKNASDPCPKSLDELSPYMDKKDTKDPWNNPYRLFCGQSMPAGAKGGIAVSSSGPDGKDNNCSADSDDICSWK